MYFNKKLNYLLTACFILLICTFNSNAQISMGDYTSHTVTDTTITVYANDSALRFSFITPEIVKVEFLPTLDTEFDSSLVVIRDVASGLINDVTETNFDISIFSSNMIINISKFPVRVSYSNEFGDLLTETEDFSVTANSHHRELNFAISPSEHFYGTGERSVSLDLYGQSFDVTNVTEYGYGWPPDNMNINIPLVLSSNHYALLIDNNFPAHYDIGAEDPSRLRLTSYGGEMVYYFILGFAPGSQVRRYVELTGYQPLPPKWSLGYLQSKYGYHDEDEARGIVDEFIEREIPIDALILDLYWFANMGDYSWNNAAFPNPTQMISDFAENGVKTILITEPYFNENSNNYSFLHNTQPDFVARTDQGEPYVIPDHWSCGCDALLFDMTNPDALDWLQNRYEILLEDGVAGFWTDLGEPETHPSNMLHYSGFTDKVHNIYNLQWAKSVYEAFRQERPDQRIFNLTRSGWAGIQRYGVNTWSGDVSRSWEGLATQRAMMLNMSLSGIAYNSSDLGGFTGTSTSELYIRWMQFGMFTPIVRAHGYENQATEPWGFGAEAEEIVTDFIKLRYNLIPYIYSMARFNSNTGIPITSPLMSMDPENETFSDYYEAYLFGFNFLVAPVVQNQQRTKIISFPFGQWVNYWTDEIVEGNQTLAVDAPLEQIPLFVQRGSIIPKQPDMQYVDQNPLDTLIVSFYPDPNSSSNTFSLYEDDGISMDYMDGQFATTLFTSTSQILPQGGSTFSYTINASEGIYNDLPETRFYLAEIHLYEQESVTFSDTLNLSSYNSLEELRQNPSGYYLNSDSNILYVQTFKNRNDSQTVSIENFYVGIEEDNTLPGSYYLSQNFPNPFNPSTEIRYGLAQSSDVKLTVYNILGQKVKTLLSGNQRAGHHKLTWDATTDNNRLAGSGIYFCQLETPHFIDTIRMIVLK